MPKTCTTCRLEPDLLRRINQDILRGIPDREIAQKYQLGRGGRLRVYRHRNCIKDQLKAIGVTRQKELEEDQLLARDRLDAAEAATLKQLKEVLEDEGAAPAMKAKAVASLASATAKLSSARTRSNAFINSINEDEERRERTEGMELLLFAFAQELAEVGGREAVEKVIRDVQLHADDMRALIHEPLANLLPPGDEEHVEDAEWVEVGQGRDEDAA